MIARALAAAAALALAAPGARAAAPECRGTLSGAGRGGSVVVDVKF